MLGRDDLDAVLIVTPHKWHAPMTIDSLKAHKFVGAEVPACVSVEECWQIVKTQQQMKTGYMLLENYNYSQWVMQIQVMAEKGIFGDVTYAYGSYIHETRSMRFKADGSLTWRGENVLSNPGVIYPTHALGPVAGWMGVDGVKERMLSVVAMQSKGAALHEWTAAKFGADSPQAKLQFANGDTSTALIRT